MDYYTLVLDPKYFQNVDTYKKGMLVFVDGYLKQKKTKLELGNPISAVTLNSIQFFFQKACFH